MFNLSIYLASFVLPYICLSLTIYSTYHLFHYKLITLFYLSQFKRMYIILFIYLLHYHFCTLYTLHLHVSQYIHPLRLSDSIRSPCSFCSFYHFLYFSPLVSLMLDSSIYFSISTITSFYYLYVLPIYSIHLSFYMYITSATFTLGSR